MANRQTISFLTQRFKDAGIWPDTKHGQNFLIDLNLVELLANSANLSKRDVVLEVGTGTGSLTAMLAQQAGAVVSVEISQQLHQLASEELIDQQNVTLLHRDVLKNKNRIEPSVMETVGEQLLQVPGGRFKLVANLPYNIATPIVSNLLSTELIPASMTVTIQKELAERITARPRTKHYGALSIWIQSQCVARIIRILPPGVFWPRPKVHSAIIQIVPKESRRAKIPDKGFFHGFVRGLFIHRRKFLRSGLVSGYKKQLGKERIDAVMAELELGPDARAEQLDVAQMLELCECMRRELRENSTS